MKQEQILAKIKTGFPFRPVTHCVEKESRIEFFIAEKFDRIANGKVPTILKKGEKLPAESLKIENLTEKEIYHLRFDGCFFSSKDQSRCDSILWDDVVFAFIEYKFDVKKSNRISRKIGDAINRQIIPTIELFDKKLNNEGLKYEGLKKEAHLFYGVKNSPRLQASRQSERIRLAETFNTKLEIHGDTIDENGILENDWKLSF